MASTIKTETSNRLLDALPPDEFKRFAAALEPVSLPLSRVLFRPDEYLTHAYFPTDSIVSLLTDLEDGSGMEVGLVGKEGLVGVSIILGGSETKIATVQGEGSALRVSAEALRAEFRLGGTLQHAFLRYTHALMTQISQSVVCNVRHPLPGRLARWLLMYNDRLERDEFSLTHEFMSNMLGVRRAGVSEIAAQLQDFGYITYRRGKVRIIDRRGLEAFACECYPVVKEKYEGFLL